MDAIVSVTRDWGIGHNGSLVVDNRADMRRFVALTCGGKRPKDAAPGEVLGTVIMGRKTFESFPGGALKARRNLVITRNESFTAPGAEVVHSVSEALASVADSNPD
ncbi:MAG: dihydrofolate reductase, partial [Coriobacteriales bacterium]|nr:dihydrofolate reductase [Coriobacteriales bacterium]